MARYEDYPVLDEEDHSQRELEDTFRNVEEAGRRFVKDGAPDDWADQLHGWLSEHDERSLYPRDGWGGYPDDDSVKEALGALGLLDDEA